MKYIFVVEWDKDFVAAWAKKQLSLAEFAITYVKSNYKNKLILAVHNDCYCQWIAPRFSESEARRAQEAINNYLMRELSIAADSGVLKSYITPYGGVSAPAQRADEKPTAEAAPQTNDQAGQHPLTVKINRMAEDLIAAVEFKALIAEIAKMAPLTADGSLGEVFEHRHYVFSVDEGYDVKKYVDVLGDALHAAGLFKGETVTTETYRLPKVEDKRNSDPIESFLSDLDDYESTVLVLDIIEWMDAVRTEDFRNVLKAIERQSECVVVFTIPYVEKDALNRVYEAINDVLNVRAVSFVPYSKEELQMAAARFLGNYSVEMTEDAWLVFHSMILKEKADGNFYGENTVKKVCREMLLAKTLANAEAGTDSKIIEADDLADVAPHEARQRSAEEMLNGLVGIDAVRKKLYEIVNQIEAARQLGDVDMPSVHMRFVGNPGTGKTTVARIMGRMLKERGLLRIGDLYEIHGRDLVGRYIGETSPKTASICRDAYGSVLFIDEAYSLCRSTEDSKDFGREALDTLIAQMENHRTDFVVIMAGYTDDIANMMKANVGLENRMPYLVEFPNYSQDELYQIYALMVKRYGKYDENLLVEAEAFFKALPDDYIKDKSFGNGRYVRNLFERTRAKAITRRQLEGAEALILKREDFLAASADNEFRSTKPADTRRKVGFN